MPRHTIYVGYKQGLSSDSNYDEHTYYTIGFNRTKLADLFDLNLRYGHNDKDGTKSNYFSATASKSNFSWAKNATFGATASKVNKEESYEDDDDLKILAFAKIKFNIQ